jgi:hypothetical protein
MGTYTKTMIALIVLAVVLAAAGTVVAGGEFVAAAAGAAATLVVLAVGVPTGKWLWKHAGRLGKRLIAAAVVILALTAVVAGWLAGGGEKLATTLLAMPTPTPTPQQTPMEQGIRASASARDVADLWIGLNYDKDQSLRRELPGSEKLVAQEGSLDPGELWAITATLGITPTQVVTKPMATLQYISSQHYTVIPHGETRHIRGIIMSPEIRVEVYELPPVEITNGDVKEITQVRHAYVIVHLVPPPPVGEIGRNNWLVAGMMLLTQ